MLRIEKLRGDAGLKSPTITRHLVFTGNPGTGKTTVARLVGGIYQALGLLSRGPARRCLSLSRSLSLSLSLSPGRRQGRRRGHDIGGVLVAVWPR